MNQQPAPEYFYPPNHANTLSISFFEGGLTQGRKQLIMMCQLLFTVSGHLILLEAE